MQTVSTSRARGEPTGLARYDQQGMPFAPKLLMNRLTVRPDEGRFGLECRGGVPDAHLQPGLRLDCDRESTDRLLLTAALCFLHRPPAYSQPFNAALKGAADGFFALSAALHRTELYGDRVTDPLWGWLVYASVQKNPAIAADGYALLAIGGAVLATKGLAVKRKRLGPINRSEYVAVYSII
jgi:hypothetical protein